MTARFALIACSACGNLWIVHTHVETVHCWRCEARYELSKRRFLAESDDKTELIAARTARLRARVER